MIDAQFLSNGQIETSYGEDGTHSAGVAGWAYAMALATNGNVLVVGGRF